ncbi:hypothetical protein [Lentzea indica]|uniref:hypothetical protein n=1 Tax=Lentzea indica TaxID=2604800 RepID=UPI001CB723AB|nr:hypothetical protein [Lentzea indica]
MVVATAMAVITAGPAGAVDDTTTTTFTVSAGALGINAPATAPLGTGAAGGTITAQMGNVVVTDARAQLAPTWAATVASGDFTTGTATTDETIANDLVGYWSGPAISPSGSGATFVPGQPTAGDVVTLAASRPAFSLTAGVGNNSVTWNPTLIVNVPAAAVAGGYTGTVTHSVV